MVNGVVVCCNRDPMIRAKLKSWINLFCYFDNILTQLTLCNGSRRYPTASWLWMGATVCVDEPLGSFFGESRSRLNFQKFSLFSPFSVIVCQPLQIHFHHHHHNNQQLFTVLVFSRLVFKVVYSIPSFSFL